MSVGMVGLRGVTLVISLALVGCEPPNDGLEDSGAAPPPTSNPAPDADADGYSAQDGDCDDAQAQVNPSATDLVGDGVDQNCDGVDGTDVDGDGVASAASGGEDCDDGIASINPYATDIVDTGIDQNCDGVDGTDADGDAVASVASGGEDCDDLDAATSPFATDPTSDGQDQNCDGVDGTDADGDRVASIATGGADCDDGRATTYPGAPDVVGNGIDDDCDGVDGVDADQDHFAGVPSGGLDCDDADAAVYPGAPDVAGDFVDQSCDFVDGLDADGDGAASVASGGADCDDQDASVDPSLDHDLDGSTMCDDCDDFDPGLFPGNVEVCDAVDQDCDAVVDFSGAVDACAREVSLTTGTGSVDVLLVVDNSCSMADEQGDLAAAAAELLAPLDGDDWHVGVVTTDMDQPSQRGKLQPGPDGQRWIDDTYDLAAATAWLEKAVDQGVMGSGTEKPLDASVSALDVLAATANAGFSRPDAELAVIFITDESDHSATTPSAWETWFADLQIDRVASVHGFVDPTVSAGISQVIGTFGGIEADVATVDWAPDAAAIGAAIHPSGAFDGVIALSELPDTATISVTATEPAGAPTVLVDGVDYAYDALLNAIVFTGYVAPAGTDLVVTYRALP